MSCHSHNIDLSQDQAALWDDASEIGERVRRGVCAQAATRAREIGRTVEIMGDGGIVLDAVHCDRGDAS